MLELSVILLEHQDMLLLWLIIR